MIATLDQRNSIWNAALEFLKSEITEKYIFESFFVENTNLYSLDNDKAIITVKSKMSKVVIEAKFIKNIEKALENVTETNFKCIIKEEAELQNNFVNDKIKMKEIDNSFSSNLNPNLIFDNFVVGSCNREAHNAALTVATDPGKFFNPLFIYGKSGIGKTHLLNAIGNYVRYNEPRSLRVGYVEIRDFIDDFVNASKNKNFSELTKKYDSLDVLLIDDIQFLAGCEGTGEFFFNIFNKLINAKKQIVLTSDRRPLDLKGIEERLVSRFSQGLSVNIESPHFDTAVSILRKKIEVNRLNDKNNSEVIPEDVIEYIALQYSSDVRQLEGALNRIIFYTINNKNKNIDINTAINALNTIGAPKNKGDLTTEKIINEVANYYNFTKEQILSKVRTTKLALARHIAMYLCRNLLDLSLTKIGAEFGGKDHTTVINATEKIEKLIKTDPAYRQTIISIKNILNT